MKKIKIIFSILLAIGLLICTAGCAEADDFNGFDPTAVRVVEKAEGVQYDTTIEDKEVTQKLWNRFKEIDISEEPDGTIGSAYIYLCFYNDNDSRLGVFTLYDNGSCCLGEDFNTLYTVANGRETYLDLCDIYDEYVNSKK